MHLCHYESCPKHRGRSIHVMCVVKQCVPQATPSFVDSDTVLRHQDRYQKKSGWQRRRKKHKLGVHRKQNNHLIINSLFYISFFFLLAFYFFSVFLLFHLCVFFIRTAFRTLDQYYFYSIKGYTQMGWEGRS